MSQILTLALKGATSSSMEPPLRQMMPFCRLFLLPAEIFPAVSLTRPGKSVTALLTTKSYFPFSSSILLLAVKAFLRPSSPITASATLIFFATESRRVNSEPGKSMARGMPGNPPPVPTSRMRVDGRKEMILAIDSE